MGGKYELRITYPDIDEALGENRTDVKYFERWLPYWFALRKAKKAGCIYTCIITRKCWKRRIK